MATYKGEVSEEKTAESHWIEFDFVDTAGNPVSAVPYDSPVPTGRWTPVS